MSEHRVEIDEDRALSSDEANLVRWLLENGELAARAYLPQLAALRVVSRCGCGCASIDFARLPDVGFEVLSDYQWTDLEDHLFGIYVFAKGGALAGLDLWSVDGGATPDVLPAVESLRPFG